MNGMRLSYCRVSAALFLTLTLCCGAEAAGQDKKDPPAENEPSIWMKKKLDYSRNILAGLASEDFDQVVANAEAMQGMSKFEGYIRSKVPGYRTQLQIFESANKEIIVQAQKDNVEGAALAFTQLTISCVNCHKQLRDAVTRAPTPKSLR